MIDNCVVLSVKVHALFVLNVELILITLNKQTITTFVNLREEHLSVLFYVTPFLIRKSVLIEWHGTAISWQAWSLVSLKALWKLIGLSSQTRKKTFPNFLSESYQRKTIKQWNAQTCTHKPLLCYACTIMFFWFLL